MSLSFDRGHLLAATTVAILLAGGAAVAQAPPAAPAAARPPPPSQDPAQVRSGVYKVDPDHSRVSWKTTHHGFSTFQATLPGATGSLNLNAANPAASTVEITLDMNRASSGIPVFDEHMKGANIFNTAKFPTATFKSTRVQRTGPKTAKVTGDLTFLGVTKPVTLDVTFHQAGLWGGGANASYRLGFDATTVLKRSDFGSTAMPTIGDSVTLEIEAEFLQPA